MNIYDILRPAETRKLLEGLNSGKIIIVSGHELDGKKDFVYQTLKFYKEKNFNCPVFNWPINLGEIDKGVILKNNSSVIKDFDLDKTVFIQLSPIKEELTQKLLSILIKNEIPSNIYDKIKFTRGLGEYILSMFYQLKQTGDFHIEPYGPNLTDKAVILLNLIKQYDLKIPLELTTVESDELKNKFYLHRVGNEYEVTAYGELIETKKLETGKLTWEEIELIQSIASKITHHHFHLVLAYLKGDLGQLQKLCFNYFKEYIDRIWFHEMLNCIDEKYFSNDHLIFLLKEFGLGSKLKIDLFTELDSRFELESLNTTQRYRYLVYKKSQAYLKNQMSSSLQLENDKFELALKLRSRGQIKRSIELIYSILDITDDLYLKNELTCTQAVNYLQDAQYEKAKIYFSDCADFFSQEKFKKNSQVARFNMAICDYHLGDITQASRIVEQILQEGVFDQSLLLSLKNYKIYLSLQFGKYEYVVSECMDLLNKKEFTFSQRIFTLDYIVKALIKLKKYTQVEYYLKELKGLVESKDREGFKIFYLKNKIELFWNLKSNKDQNQLLKDLLQIKNDLPNKYRLDYEIAKYKCRSLNGVGDKAILELENFCIENEISKFECDPRIYRAMEYSLQGHHDNALNILLKLVHSLKETGQYGKLKYVHNRIIEMALKMNCLDTYQEMILNFSGLEGESLIVWRILNIKEDKDVRVHLNQFLAELHSNDKLKPYKIIYNNLIYKKGFSFLLPFLPVNLKQDELKKVGSLFELLNLDEIKIQYIANGIGEELSLQDYIHKEKLDCNILFFDEIAEQVLYNGQELRIQRESQSFKLLKFFVENAHTKCSKEDIINHVWLEDYNPLVHDSYIYQGIHKLKQLLKSDLAIDELILNGQDFYYFNPKLSVKAYLKIKEYDLMISKRELWVKKHFKFNDKLYAIEYAENNEVSLRTAQRDLAKQVQANRLHIVGKGKACYYLMDHSIHS